MLVLRELSLLNNFISGTKITSYVPEALKHASVFEPLEAFFVSFNSSALRPMKITKRFLNCSHTNRSRF